MALAKAGYKRVPREVLNANRTYYVRTDGNDSNTGLVNDAAGAFLTIAKALLEAAKLDCRTFNLTVQVGAGTWTVPVVLPQMTGSGTFAIVGDAATPANVIVSVTSNHCFLATSINSRWIVNGFKVQTTTSGSGLYATGGAIMLYLNIDFGACATSHIRVDSDAAIIATGATTISRTALIHWHLDSNGYLFDAGFTITLTGTPAFSNAFLQASGGSMAKINNNTFVGSATGKRFSLTEGSVAGVNGAAQTYLPGNSAGTLTGGAVWDVHLGGVRELLTANRTYYVRTDGSNNNNGLANTAGGAFLTLQKAWDTVAALDLSIYTVTIQVGDGTYTAGINMAAMPVGGSGIFITGNTTTPANVHLNCTTTNFEISAPLPCAMTIRGFKCTFTGASLSAVYIRAAGTLTVLEMELAGGSTSSAGAYRANGAGAKLQIFAAQTITGGMSCYVQALGGGHVQFSSTTVTLTGTPAFSWLTVNADSFGYVSVAGVTFSGSATGTRYGTGLNGGINTGGGGASFIPGSVAGSVATNGWYV